MRQIAVFVVLGVILWFGFDYLIGYAKLPSYSLETSSPDLMIDGQRVTSVFRFADAVVLDGDTVRVSGDRTEPFDVRLASIDAPEMQQSFGNEAKLHLAGLLANQSIVAWETGDDRYGRKIAFLFVERANGGLEEVNAQMVRDGYAWHYPQYSSSQTFETFQYEARESQLGLWNAAQAPVPPWEYRRE